MPSSGIPPQNRSAGAGAWRQFWQDVALGWRDLSARFSAWLLAFGRGRAGKPRQWLPARFASRRAARRPVAILAVLLLACTLVGSCGLINVLNLLDARTVARDLTAQVATIQALLKDGSYLDPRTLLQVQAHLNMLDGDLQRIQGDIPLEPIVASAPRVDSAVHLLRMARAFVHAGQAGIDAALILVPHLKGALSSLQSPSTTASPQSSSTGTPSATPSPTASPTTNHAAGSPLTQADMNRASADLDTAETDLQQALTERPQVHDDDLRSLGLSSIIPMLHKLDSLAPKLPTYLGYAHVVAAALPALLGITKPVNFLFVDQDSDELRPTGGFIGNYAVLTLSGGKLASGIHLHDIYQLDCPHNFCAYSPIPARFAWMIADPTQFALRDSNLDPDFPTSARFAEQLYTQEGGPPVAGVIYITPTLIEQMLQVTGPLAVQPFGTTVTAQNLRQLIHYYHVASSLGIIPTVPGGQLQTSNRKAFDAVLGSALVQRIATLSPAQQSALARVVLNALVTRDVQFYLNDPSMEGLLSTFGDSGSLPASPGDSLFVVDTNTGGNYANDDVQEHVADTVTLDAHGTATHNLTITYTYPIVRHLYDAVWNADTGGKGWTYRDFVRVMVPASAHLSSQDGCFLYPTTEAQRAVWACQIFLVRPQGTTLHFRWTVPAAAIIVNGVTQYRLLVQRQAGAHVTVSITIVLPPHRQVAPPVIAPLTAGPGGSVRFTGALTQDQHLLLRFTP